MSYYLITILLIVFIFLFILTMFLSKLQKKKVDKVMAIFKGQEIVLMAPSANFFGTKSKGMAQIRGNGVLVLTNKEFYYEMWTPQKVLRIPLSRLKEVDTAKIFLGKSKGKTLLVLNYLNELDEMDSSAWLVGNIEEWIEALKKN